MKSIAFALSTLLTIAACTGFEPQIVASGNLVTTTHKVLRYNDGLAMAKEYCALREKDVRHIRTVVETRAISYFECI